VKLIYRTPAEGSMTVDGGTPIYLDHNATTPLAPEALDAMLPFLRQDFGNPSSSHAYGRRARDAVDQARQQVAGLLGCQAADLVFTGSGTEANNLAIAGALKGRTDGRQGLVNSVLEHPAVQEPMLDAAGFQLTRLPVDSAGVVEETAWRALVGPHTALVSVMHANNEMGAIQPVRRLADHAHSVGALMHTDAAQSAGKVPVQVAELGVDLLTLVAHKFCGPKGVGALFIRPGTPIHPLVLGAGHERGLRAGTENVCGIVGMGVACELARVRFSEDTARLRSLRATLLQRLQARIPGLLVNGPPVEVLCNTLNVSFPGVSGAAVLRAAPQVAASTGSACHGEEESTVLLAMGLPRDRARGAVRLSLGRVTTEEDVERAADHLAQAFQQVHARG